MQSLHVCMYACVCVSVWVSVFQFALASGFFPPSPEVYIRVRVCVFVLCFCSIVKKITVPPACATIKARSLP